MTFPQTRLTLIQRLAAGGAKEDWGAFLKDYWGPVCRFAMRFGAGNLDDAEDVASQAFEVLWAHRLLVRWVNHRSAKLRTLMCSVVRRILANRGRAQANRQRLAREVADSLRRTDVTSDEQVDVFYAAWVEDVVHQAVESLAAEYYRRRKGDYVRVLYGRLCRGMTIAEVAEALKRKPSDVDNYYRHARARLGERLETLLREQIGRYCSEAELAAEFQAEWDRLGEYLAEHGGLEEAVRRAYHSLDPIAAAERRSSGIDRAMTRLTSVMRSGPESDLT